MVPQNHYRIYALSILLLGVFGSSHFLFKHNPHTGRATNPDQSNSSCLSCHVTALPEHDKHIELSCTACHLGNELAEEADSAHQGMISIPGNLEDSSKTCGVCHAQEVSDVHHSLMTTNAGIVSVDRFVFGEQETPNGDTAISEIGDSAADHHLRNLCASCHLGNKKVEFAPVDDASRGGGCNACHLNYTTTAQNELATYLKDSTQLPTTHPSLDIDISDRHCLGCHSRSGRISMNYQGYHETALKSIPVGNSGTAFQQLQDGRIFEYVGEDVHHAKGLACIDCHGYADVMGDGKTYQHEEQAVKIRCEDCHLEQGTTANTIDRSALTDIYERLYRSRGYSHSTMLKTSEAGVPLINTYLPGDDSIYLFGKTDRSLHPVKPTSISCSRKTAHQRLSCSACHTSWAPQCIQCHTTYDPEMVAYDLLDNRHMKGGWIEFPGEMKAEAPTLGVDENEASSNIRPAIPGMIMTLDKGSYPQLPNKSEAHQSPKSFHRLFAPVAPHTTTREGRSCKSCHLNPVALGYGRGTLTWASSHWKFEPESPPKSQDGLPPDAWIPFLGSRTGPVATRDTFRPFSHEEQKRILRVGACLTCHAEGSKVIQQTLERNLDAWVQNLPEACNYAK